MYDVDTNYKKFAHLGGSRARFGVRIVDGHVREEGKIPEGGINMKKSLIIGAAFAAALSVGGQRVLAQTFCLDVQPGFCDQAQVTVQGDLVFGLWDWLCDGVSLIPVLGTGDFGGGSFTGSPPPGTVIGMWDVNVATRTMDFVQSDGASVVVTFSGVPLHIAPGACNFALSSGGTSLME